MLYWLLFYNAIDNFKEAKELCGEVKQPEKKKKKNLKIVREKINDNLLSFSFLIKKRKIPYYPHTAIMYIGKRSNG